MKKKVLYEQNHVIIAGLFFFIGGLLVFLLPAVDVVDETVYKEILYIMVLFPLASVFSLFTTDERSISKKVKILGLVVNIVNVIGMYLLFVAVSSA